MDYKMLKTYSVDVLRRILASIRRNKNFVDISSLKGEQMPKKIDILTYSFPCQDLSNVGAFHGYNKGTQALKTYLKKINVSTSCILFFSVMVVISS